MKLKRPRVCVLVLGDLGRSPRMQYHALSLAAEGADVDLVGDAGSDLPAALRDEPRVSVHRLPAARSLDPGRGPRLWLDAVARVVRQTAALLRLLVLRLPRPRLILVQTPPAVPALAVAWLTARLRRAKLLIDWHNLGYTLLALKLGARHPMVRVLARAERVQGRRADGHLCVSERMRAWLEEEWGLLGVRVLYDRPASAFAPPSPGRDRDLLARLGLATEGVERPALLVSASSWTPDEDFALLARALEIYDRQTSAAGGRRPRLEVVLTGRGPLRAQWQERFAALALRRVAVRTLWLAPDDYPRLLAAADLGLCCHRSSSGLDLPMKIADMLGSGLPVCALDVGPVMAERLRPGVDGALFATGEGLARRLLELLDGFPDPASPLAELRAALARRPAERWHDGWLREARPAVEELL